jgi:hypothetical protein
VPKRIQHGVIHGFRYRGISPVLWFGTNLVSEADDGDFRAPGIFLPDEVFDLVLVELLFTASLLPFASSLPF